MKILLCFGTRPEAIKMAPVFHELKKKGFDVKICVTAQHREMLDQVLDFFEIIPDYDLNLMKPNQTLNELSASILSNLDEIILKEKPNLILVHGDTTTSAVVALAGFNLGIKVGHVEAGLRTYDKKAPFPEEVNRQLTSRLADLHFTPTDKATKNLSNEGILTSTVLQTGNTVVDALFWTLEKINTIGYQHPEIEVLKKILVRDKKIVLVTGHRRENFGEGFQNICDALLELSKRDDVLIVYPVHLNPSVKDIVELQLSDIQNILLISPVSYPAFVWLMQQSFLILTDSGGIQEEAPSIGKPVVVTRTISERPEGVDAGFSKLVGSDKILIIDSVVELLDNFKGFKNNVNPYGSGNASEKIVNFLLKVDK